MTIAPSPGEALHAVTLNEAAFVTLHDLIPRMDDEQLVETYRRADELGKRAWLVQAHCLWEARRRREHHNDPALADLARSFGISQQYAGRLCGAWSAVPDELRNSSGDLPLAKSFYVAAGETDTPQEWVAWAEDRKAENPGYSVRDFRAEIEQDQHLFDQPSAPEPRAVHFSSASPEWYTPRPVIDAVINFFDAIDLDPCANSHKAPNVPASARFTKDDDGLTRPWFGRVYMNPPYGREIPPWIEKACGAYETREIEAAILLVPARTDTEWWRRMRDYPVCLIDGRLRFIGPEGEVAPAPFPSALVYLGDEIDRFASAVAHLGDVWVRHQGGQR